MLKEKFCILIVMINISLLLYGLITDRNLFKQLIFLNLLQSFIILLYIISAYKINILPPIINSTRKVVDPIPHTLMLTAIVVGIVVFSIGCTMIAKIKENFKTINEKEIKESL